MTQINPRHYYNLQEMFEQKFFPWIKSYSTFRRWIERDAQDRNILEAKIIGRDTGRRYFIKGENIIKFIAMFEDGTLHETSREEVKKMSDLEGLEEKQPDVEASTEADTAATAAEESSDVAAGESEDAGELLEDEFITIAIY